MKPVLPTYQAIVALPRFALGIRTDADAITGLDYLPAQGAQAPTTLLAAEAVRQVERYLADPRHVFALPLAPCGSRFQQRVRDAIAAIPSGQTRTYGEIARAVHSAARAVGGACGANPYPLVVPCHRVVAAQGIGGFARTAASDGGWYLDIKRWLLAHEHP